MITPKEFRAVRKRVRLTQVEAAKLGNVSWMTLMRYEGGRILRMYPKTAQGLQRAYDAMITRPPKVKAVFQSRWRSVRIEPEGDNTMNLSLLHPHRGGPAKESMEYRGRRDPERLRKMVESFLRQNSIGIVERESMAYFVLPPEKVYELCRQVILSVGQHEK